MTANRTFLPFVVASTLGLSVLSAVAQDLDEVKEAVGWFDLEARLGSANMPSGAGVGVLQCEAPSGTQWIPDIDDVGHFGGKTFTIPWGNPDTSSHAQTVASKFYSNIESIAPGIDNIWLYEANNYLNTGYLNIGQASSVPPITPPDPEMRIHNNSWIGQFNSSGDNLALRRIDFASIRDNLLILNGTQNGGTSLHMWAHAFNTLTVGSDGGGHSTMDVPSGIDGPGRMKPWIVAPGEFTSFTTPVVGAVGALLYETVETDPVLAADFASNRIQVMQATLLAGATQMEGWTNNPDVSGDFRGSTSRPIDDVFGAGLVNVDRSHRILTGYKQIGATTLAEAPVISSSGWDWPRILAGQERWWRFTVTNPLEEFIAVLTWQRVPTTTFTGYSLMDIDLELMQIVDEQAESLVGDVGVGVFDSGNVRSVSAVDNVEMLVVSGLQPGEYAIRATRNDIIQTTYSGIAWIMIGGDPPAIPGDLDGSGFVDGFDLSILLGAWGTDSVTADIDLSGLVDGADLAILLGNWT